MKKHQLYALCVYKRRPGGRRSYYRISPGAYHKGVAVRTFQSLLIYASMAGIPIALRAVRTAHSDTAPGVGVVEYAVLGDKLRTACVYRELIRGSEGVAPRLGSECLRQPDDVVHTLKSGHYYMAPSSTVAA